MYIREAACIAFPSLSLVPFFFLFLGVWILCLVQPQFRQSGSASQPQPSFKTFAWLQLTGIKKRARDMGGRCKPESEEKKRQTNAQSTASRVEGERISGRSACLP